jgi:hypothetical protein
MKIPIRQYNREGKYIRTFESCSEAARYIEGHVASLTASTKLENSYKGYYWRFAEGKKELKIPIRQYNRGGKNIIIKKMIKGKLTLLMITQTISEASDVTGVPHSSIRVIARSKDINKISKGYNFRFVNEEDKYNKRPKFDGYDWLRKRKRKRFTIPVTMTDLKTGKSYNFNSINEAARELNINRIGIIHVLKGRYKTTEGYSVTPQ